ncbi:MAG: Uma2 family endonuclease [Prochlorothrix sp.]|nr:Uma2 family endonuclease [Prochlorothrix sp.]
MTSCNRILRRWIERDRGLGAGASFKMTLSSCIDSVLARSPMFTSFQPAYLYPESDGKPMVDNTKQYRWVVRLTENLKRLFLDSRNPAFVGTDLFWYPVEGRSDIVCAPDVFVALGRPAGDRGSYQQWKEDQIAPQVVFEVLSPSNTMAEMAAKQSFYVQYGAAEIYFYNPDTLDFWGFVQDQDGQPHRLLLPLHLPWTSPRLGVTFRLGATELEIVRRDGQLFEDPSVWANKLDRAMAKLRELGIDPQMLEGEP